MGLLSEIVTQSTTASLRGTLGELCDRIAREVEAEFYSNYLAAADSDELKLENYAGLNSDQKTALRKLAFDESLSADPAHRREPTVLDDLSRNSSETVAGIRMLGVRAYVGIPLRTDGRLLGTLAFGFTSRDTIEEHDLNFIRAACDVVALGLERADLLTEIEAFEKRTNSFQEQFAVSQPSEIRPPLNPDVPVAQPEIADSAALPAEGRIDFEANRNRVTLDARLIDDLLDFTQISGGKLPLVMGEVDVHAVLREALDGLRPELTEKRIKLSTDLIAPPPVIWGDSVRLKQIFWNLLKNAAKFTPAGGRIAVKSRVAPESGKLVITFADTGVGIRTEDIGRVFEVFVPDAHLNRDDPHRLGGLGLGLAISQRLAELHSGKITAESAGAMQGSTFTLELPLVETARVHAQAPAAQFQQAGSNTNAAQRRVLIVEDHEPTRTALASLLERRNYDVLTAGSVAEARTLADRDKIDLLVADIGLPDGDGYALMSELRQHHALKGIAVTGHGMEQDVERSREAGFLAHLTKPVLVKTLDGALAMVAD